MDRAERDRSPSSNSVQYRTGQRVRVERSDSRREQRDGGGERRARYSEEEESSEATGDQADNFQNNWRRESNRDQMPARSSDVSMDNKRQEDGEEEDEEEEVVADNEEEEEDKERLMHERARDSTSQHVGSASEREGATPAAVVEEETSPPRRISFESIFGVFQGIRTDARVRERMMTRPEELQGFHLVDRSEVDQWANERKLVPPDSGNADDAMNPSDLFLKQLVQRWCPSENQPQPSNPTTAPQPRARRIPVVKPDPHALDGRERLALMNSLLECVEANRKVSEKTGEAAAKAEEVERNLEENQKRTREENRRFAQEMRAHLERRVKAALDPSMPSQSLAPNIDWQDLLSSLAELGRQEEALWCLGDWKLEIDPDPGGREVPITALFCLCTYGFLAGCARSGNLRLLQFLKEKVGLQMNLRIGWTLRDLSFQSNERGPPVSSLDLSPQFEKLGEAVMGLAAFHGNWKVVEWCLEKGKVKVCPEVPTAAALGGRWDVLEKLEERGDFPIDWELVLEAARNPVRRSSCVLHLAKTKVKKLGSESRSAALEVYKKRAAARSKHLKRLERQTLDRQLESSASERGERRKENAKKKRGKKKKRRGDDVDSDVAEESESGGGPQEGASSSSADPLACLISSGNWKRGGEGPRGDDRADEQFLFSMYQWWDIPWRGLFEEQRETCVKISLPGDIQQDPNREHEPEKWLEDLTPEEQAEILWYGMQKATSTNMLALLELIPIALSPLKEVHSIGGDSVPAWCTRGQPMTPRTHLPPAWETSVRLVRFAAAWQKEEEEAEEGEESAESEDDGPRSSSCSARKNPHQDEEGRLKGVEEAFSKSNPMLEWLWLFVGLNLMDPVVASHGREPRLAGAAEGPQGSRVEGGDGLDGRSLDAEDKEGSTLVLEEVAKISGRETNLGTLRVCEQVLEAERNRKGTLVSVSVDPPAQDRKSRTLQVQQSSYFQAFEEELREKERQREDTEGPYARMNRRQRSFEGEGEEDGDEVRKSVLEKDAKRVESDRQMLHCLSRRVLEGVIRGMADSHGNRLVIQRFLRLLLSKERIWMSCLTDDEVCEILYRERKKLRKRRTGVGPLLRFLERAIQERQPDQNPLEESDEMSSEEEQEHRAEWEEEEEEKAERGDEWDSDDDENEEEERERVQSRSFSRREREDRRESERSPQSNPSRVPKPKGGLAEFLRKSRTLGRSVGSRQSDEDEAPAPSPSSSQKASRKKWSSPADKWSSDTSSREGKRGGFGGEADSQKSVCRLVPFLEETNRQTRGRGEGQRRGQVDSDAESDSGRSYHNRRTHESHNRGPSAPPLFPWGNGQRRPPNPYSDESGEEDHVSQRRGGEGGEGQGRPPNPYSDESGEEDHVSQRRGGKGGDGQRRPPNPYSDESGEEDHVSQRHGGKGGEGLRHHSDPYDEEYHDESQRRGWTIGGRWAEEQNGRPSYEGRAPRHSFQDSAPSDGSRLEGMPRRSEKAEFSNDLAFRDRERVMAGDDRDDEEFGVDHEERITGGANRFPYSRSPSFPPPLPSPPRADQRDRNGRMPIRTGSLGSQLHSHRQREGDRASHWHGNGDMIPRDRPEMVREDRPDLNGWGEEEEERRGPKESQRGRAGPNGNLRWGRGEGWGA
uniref:Uncharacterized protein n=1 Tax=Chromera velia CCMP2878 TaxID=1169474 RepID=A0A0G4FQ83_9ALVE|eukprot:Cvel_3574.t1-p1 / transcript=Cvel_3574.t1 / gene=Cvel_3574 / organism=Chromera_velia_CCMP2878 / gene_product=hypothetical protein / transcript_product=hypothetical protein / location=Cvel_scaffold146:54765-62480(+) / protein_length=1623 / sequence_SO=supercontig / SO=protein_coding / is_pseudo=false